MLYVYILAYGLLCNEHLYLLFYQHMGVVREFGICLFTAHFHGWFMFIINTYQLFAC